MTTRIVLRAGVLLLALVAGVSDAWAGFTGMDPPRWAAKQMKLSGIEPWPGDDDGAPYIISRHLPTYLVEGDFDGDKKMDIAVLVRRKVDEKFGIAVLLRSGTAATVLGAGTRFGGGGEDFRWMDSWSARGQEGFSKQAQSAWKGPAPKSTRDGLVVAKSGARNARSGLICYDGSAFVWFPVTD